MQLTNQETQKILLAENVEEVKQVLKTAQDISSWDGKSSLEDHAQCLLDALSSYTMEQRAYLMNKEINLQPGEKNGYDIKVSFSGPLSDEELENVAGGCGGDDGPTFEVCGGGETNPGVHLTKPVIYLYPQQETDITVEVLQNKMQFTCVYPALNDGIWKVSAKPDGTLTANGREYNYLYWEGKAIKDWEDMSQGFCVASEDTAAFFEKSLAELGLNYREVNELIVYWLPLLQKNPYNLISFQFENYNSLAPLKITPAPDTLIRVYFVVKPLKEAVVIEPQKLTAPKRHGFTVIEWGGSLLD